MKCDIFYSRTHQCSKGVVHRDLKPENLLLQYKDSDSQIKIADFGFAKKATSDQSLKTVCGTPGYVAPELLFLEKYGTKADMWSLGVITYILLGGYPPFYAETNKELIRMTKRGEFKFHEEHWGDIGTDVKDMISSMLVKNPAKRASASDVLAHPWMKQDRKKLQRVSLVSSQDRLKAHVARQRLKKAFHGVFFLKKLQAGKLNAGEERQMSICQQNAVFTGRKKECSISV